MEVNDRDLQVIISSGKEDPNITKTDQWGDSQLTQRHYFSNSWHYWGCKDTVLLTASNFVEYKLET